jgi:hypothetical protein
VAGIAERVSACAGRLRVVEILVQKLRLPLPQHPGAEEVVDTASLAFVDEDLVLLALRPRARGAPRAEPYRE